MSQPATPAQPQPSTSNSSFFVRIFGSVKCHSTSELRPWIKTKSPDFKAPILMKSVLSEDCLQSSFKCMFPTCSFYTSVAHHFKSHLQRHSGLQRCSYCSFSGFAFDLFHHILHEHARCKFACGLCFYRAVDKFLVFHHFKVHHKNAQMKIFNVNNAMSNVQLDLQTVKFNRNKFIHPIVCASKF